MTHEFSQAGHHWKWKTELSLKNEFEIDTTDNADKKELLDVVVKSEFGKLLIV